jgi:hypothetical protein
MAPVRPQETEQLRARQNPLTKFESWMQRIIEVPFARLFPSRVEPVEIARKLERAMEDNLMLQSEGRRLAPNVYDIYLSMKDHQQLSPSQAVLIRDWQNNLIEYARRHHFSLRTVPVLRLHSDTSLGTGGVRIEAELADRQSSGTEGVMATQALSAEQVAQLRAQLPQLDPAAASSSPATQPSGSAGSQASAGRSSAASSVHQSSVGPAMPQAWLTIQLPQAGQQVYRIEKPIINIGRQLSNDIIVEDKRVSRYHAQIKYQSDGSFAIFDLGSTNGITINSTPHMRQHVLQHGDRFTIGSYDFNFQRR